MRPVYGAPIAAKVVIQRNFVWLPIEGVEVGSILSRAQIRNGQIVRGIPVTTTMTTNGTIRTMVEAGVRESNIMLFAVEPIQ